ncbi:SDR family NAD(P)-dependent oxidoreductase [Natrialba swarupiae]|uniref:3-oxoacyl-ACP reductase FabG n=1 Tax=Natrialba swarupiae TaxID=2448032 RepID=A0A5D5AFY3_9EURY|nr:3-oxoacyl-ACP reductase family protein [Natrialba swarupiae]TYT60676.1 3-oxoacyl-ACP reductase FabG [Natrialba swarupiae]
MDGKTAIVTGSSSGIGKAVAKRLADDGANVVVNSRSRERAKAAAEDIGGDGRTVVPIEADITEYDEVEALLEQTTDEFERVDVLVNNAGMTIIDDAETFDPEEWSRVIDVNLNGTFYCSQAAGTRMIEQGDGGQIISISSLLSRQGLAKRTPYAAAKGGINSLTRCLAVEWADEGIHVNALAPGFIKTDITEQTQESAGYTDDDIRDRTPLGRYGTLEEMANCVSFLAAGDHFITGEVLQADGGWLANSWGPTS